MEGKTVVTVTPSDEALKMRQEACRRRIAGEPVNRICRDLGKSRDWFYFWWRRLHQEGAEGLCDRSRAPLHLARKTAPHIEEAIVTCRKILVGCRRKEDGYDSIGAQAVLLELQGWGFSKDELPCERTVNRILKRHALFEPPLLNSPQPEGFYPALLASKPNDVHELDIVCRQLVGGESIFSFHTIDPFAQRVCLRAYEGKTAKIAKDYLLSVWRTLGLPTFLVMDNEATFSGGKLHPRCLSQVMRLCLFVGVQAVFTPFYAPKAKPHVEGFNSLFEVRFWRKHRFSAPAQVQQKLSGFEAYCNDHRRIARLGGKTPTQAAKASPVSLLKGALTLPEHLPLVEGKVHFVRQVDREGQVEVLNERFEVGADKWGEYVWVTLDTKQQVLLFYHRVSADAPRQLIQKVDYPLHERVLSRRQVAARKGRGHSVRDVMSQTDSYTSP